MIRRLLMVALSLSLTGCVAAMRSARISDALASFVGRDVGEAVAKYGPPAQTFPGRDGGMVVAWQSFWTPPAQPRKTGGYSTGAGAAFGAMANVLEQSRYEYQSQGPCRYWFEVDADGIIRYWHWRGAC